MKISILIPTYQRLDLLIQALDSVMQQTLLPDEIVIGDDSKDTITEEYVLSTFIPKTDLKVRYFHHTPSLKQARNVDFLIKQASFELVLILHDDDLLMPRCLELLRKPLEKCPEAVASFGNQYFIMENGDLIKKSEQFNAKYYRTPEREGIVNGEWASVVQMFPNDAFLVRSKEARKIGYYAEGRGGDAVDFYFGFRLGIGNVYYYLNEYTAKYRFCDQSVSGSGSTEFMSATLKIILEDLDISKQELPEVKKKIKELIITKDMVERKAPALEVVRELDEAA
jgi:glycosyltransferase involved in cell wall biosynthesis